MQALSLEYVIGQIYGKEVFLQEIESLIKKSPDPKRWQAMKERLDNDVRLSLSDVKQPVVGKTPERQGGKVEPKKTEPPPK